MHVYVSSAGVLIVAYVIYYIANSFITSRRHARQAREWGCKPAVQRPYRLPFGIDMATRVMKADKEQVVPQELLAIFAEMVVPTFEQNFLGTKAYMTADPKNVQGMLAC